MVLIRQFILAYGTAATMGLKLNNGHGIDQAVYISVRHSCNNGSQIEQSHGIDQAVYIGVRHSCNNVSQIEQSPWY
jgi:pyridoxine 5'-phosphate synthase PdxJ